MDQVRQNDELAASGQLALLHVSPSFAPAWRYGGPIESSYQLCRQLAASNCHVEVLTTDADGLDRVLAVNKSRSVEIAKGLSVRYCRRIFRHSVSPELLRLLVPRVRSADVVHLHGVYSFPTIPALLACRIVKKPLIWTLRGSLQRFTGWRRPGAKLAWEWLCRRVAPRNLVLHVTSDEEGYGSAGRLGEHRTVVVPNGVEIPGAIPGPITRTDDALRLLFLGRLDPKKGLENLLAACRILRQRATVAVRLTVAGSGSAGYEQSLRALVERLGLGPVVTLAGEIRGRQKEEAFRDANVLVMPSFSENFGNVVAEALARSIPVIASKGSPWAEVEKVGCGLWVDNVPESLADAIERISRMSLREMGERGRNWMLAEYSWEEIARRMHRVYLSMAERRSRLLAEHSVEPSGAAAEV